MENNVAYLYTDNTYMSIGFKNLPYNNYHFHSHSINALADHDADTHSFIFIDLDSLEKAREIKISLLSEKLSSFPYVILIGESKLRFFFRLLLPNATIIKKESINLFLKMLNEGEGYSLIIDNIKSLPEQRLTKREFQIVLLFIDGWNQTDICKKLKIKEKTLYCHTSSALGKMGVRKISHIMMSSKPY